MFLCNSYQSMHFFDYTSTIGWLADTVDIFLISATVLLVIYCRYNSFVLSYIGCA
jgi:hypothetical protein